MVPRKSAVMGLVCCVALLASGCSAEPEKPSVSTSTETSSPVVTSQPTDLPWPGVPNVSQPLDASKYLSRPCDVLAPEQVSAFLGDNVPGKPDIESQVGPECDWARFDGTVTGVHIIFTKPHLGLSKIYFSPYKFFLPLEPIHNYPIVAFGLADDRSRGDCHTAVGIRNDTSIDVVFTVKRAEIGKTDSCAMAREVAGAIILNIQGNQ